jgi:undecaprenyl-diphosphatase
MSEPMPLEDAILLGVIQGLTEFLPISSTAHLLVARKLMGHEHPEDALTTVIQLGTLIAVLIYFAKDIVRLTVAVLRDFAAFKLGSSAESKLAWLIVLGTVPVVIVGLKFKKIIKHHFYDIPTMGAVAILFALLMLASEVWTTMRKVDLGKTDLEEREISYREALWVGLWQCLALMPGASRSGTTITAGLFAGLSRPAAARFSFLLSLPAVLGAGLKELYDERNELLASQEQAIPLLVATLVSAVVGYLSIAFLIGFLKRYSMLVFVVYRLILGGTILGLVWAKLL